MLMVKEIQNTSIFLGTLAAEIWEIKDRSSLIPYSQSRIAERSGQPPKCYSGIADSGMTATEKFRYTKMTKHTKSYYT